MTFDIAKLQLIAPRVRGSYVEAFLRSDHLADAGFLDGSFRMPHFLAQVCHETLGLTVLVENLYYRAERMMAIWPTRFRTLDEARPFVGNPASLAERVYGGRMGNKDLGDGFKYIGRGMLQITGRDMYQEIGNKIGVDLVKQPYLAASPEFALQVAIGIWQLKGCMRFADADNILAVTRRINGGTTGLADRRKWLAKAKKVLGA